MTPQDKIAEARKWLTGILNSYLCDKDITYPKEAQALSFALRVLERCDVDVISKVLHEKGVSVDFIEHVDTDDEWLENSKLFRYKISQAILTALTEEQPNG